METEIWKDIVEYEGLYQVSNLGKVRGLSRLIIVGNYKRLVKQRILKPGTDVNGYLFVCLYNGINHRMFRIHRLVAIHFIPNTENKPEVNHIDGIKMNNYALNFEWVNRSENILHGFKIGIIKKSQLNKFGKDHKSSIPVYQYDMNGNFMHSYDGMTEAERKTGIKQSGISRCASGRRNHAGNFIWKTYQSGSQRKNIRNSNQIN